MTISSNRLPRSDGARCDTHNLWLVGPDGEGICPDCVRPKDAMPNPLLTAREASEMLGVAERTVRRWIKRGDLEAAKSGGAYRIDPHAARQTYESSRSGRGAAREKEMGLYVRHALLGEAFAARMYGDNPDLPHEAVRAYRWAEEQFLRIRRGDLSEQDLIA